MGSKERFYYHITSLNPEVTGSCHLVTINYPDGRKKHFAVDCGLYQEKTYNELNHKQFPFSGEKIDFVLVTHNHADHMGRLPYLVNGGFLGKIYATDITARFMHLALEDSFKILKEDAKKHSKPLVYNEDDLVQTLSSIVPCEFEQVQYVDRNTKVTFFMNGHLLGAAMILVQISYPGEQDINLFFTGDYKPHNIFFETNKLPEWVLELPLTIITESTYGYMDTTEVTYHMENDLEEAIKSGKTVLITIFAQGRAQEMMYMLKCMQQNGKISTEIPIRMDGNLAQEYTIEYKNSTLLEENGKNDFAPENFDFISKENRTTILQGMTQQIILTTSGMADYGPAQLYLDNWVQREDVLIYIPGYTAPETLGYKLQHPIDGLVMINGRWHIMNAEVLTTNEWSSHAKADEIIEFLQQFKKLNLVLINHGQNESKQQMAEKIVNQVSTKRVEILGEYTFKVSCHGYVKHMSSNLIFPEKNESKSLVESSARNIKKEKKHPYIRRNRKRKA